MFDQWPSAEEVAMLILQANPTGTYLCSYANIFFCFSKNVCPSHNKNTVTLWQFKSHIFIVTTCNEILSLDRIDEFTFLNHQ